MMALARGRDRAGAFAGVDLEAWESDSYASHPTEDGRRWGLTEWQVDNPSAWVKSFGGPPGTGLVVLPPDVREQRLEEIRRVAEYGIMRR